MQRREMAGCAEFLADGAVVRDVAVRERSAEVLIPAPIFCTPLRIGRTDGCEPREMLVRNQRRRVGVVEIVEDRGAVMGLSGWTEFNAVSPCPLLE